MDVRDVVLVGGRGVLLTERAKERDVVQRNRFQPNWPTPEIEHDPICRVSPMVFGGLDIVFNVHGVGKRRRSGACGGCTQGRAMHGDIAQHPSFL